MDIEQYRAYCLAKKGVTESTPFPKVQNILVYKVMGKMFTATDLENFDGFSIKCVPETIEELRAQHTALHEPAYFSKNHWCNVVMDGSASDEMLHQWLDISYDLVVAKLSKKVQAELKNQE